MDMGTATPLDRVRPGEAIRILRVADPTARLHVSRLGFGPGSVAVCRVNGRWGPVVLAAGEREVAIGRSLARLIIVSRGEGDPRDRPPDRAGR